MENDFQSCEFVPASLYKKFEVKFYCKQRNGFYLEKESRTGLFVVVESTNEHFRDGDVVQVIDGENISKKTQNQVNSLSLTANFHEVIAEPLTNVLLQQQGNERKRIKRRISDVTKEQHVTSARKLRDAAKIGIDVYADSSVGIGSGVCGGGVSCNG